MRGDDDEVGCPSPTGGPTDVLRRRRPPDDSDSGNGKPGELERLLVEQPDPVLAGAQGELLTETEIVVSVATGAFPAVARRASAWTRSPEFPNCTMSPRTRIRSTWSSANHSRAPSMRRSRCSGSNVLIQRDPDGSSSQWRSLRTPMRTVGEEPVSTAGAPRARPLRPRSSARDIPARRATAAPDRAPSRRCARAIGSPSSCWSRP
jgi:hypothetical protein